MNATEKALTNTSKFGQRRNRNILYIVIILIVLIILKVTNFFILFYFILFFYISKKCYFKRTNIFDVTKYYSFLSLLISISLHLSHD